MVPPQLATARDNNIHEYKTILKQLRLVYNNPEETQEGKNCLLSIEQDTDSFQSLRLILQGKGILYSSAFRKGLNSKFDSYL